MCNSLYYRMNKHSKWCRNTLICPFWPAGDALAALQSLASFSQWDTSVRTPFESSLPTVVSTGYAKISCDLWLFRLKKEPSGFNLDWLKIGFWMTKSKIRFLAIWDWLKIQIDQTRSHSVWGSPKLPDWKISCKLGNVVWEMFPSSCGLQSQCRVNQPDQTNSA